MAINAGDAQNWIFYWWVSYLCNLHLCTKPWWFTLSLLIHHQLRSPTNSCCFIIFNLKNSTRMVPFLKFAVFFLSKFPGFNTSIALVRTTFFVFCFLLRPIYIWFSGLKKSNIVRRQIEGRKGFLFPTSKKAETSTVTWGSLCYLFREKVQVVFIWSSTFSRRIWPLVVEYKKRTTQEYSLIAIQSFASSSNETIKSPSKF